MSQDSSPVRETQVTQQMKFLADNCATLATKAKNFTDRVVGIVNVPCHGKVIENTKEEELCPLATEIRAIRYEMLKVIDVLQDFLDRCEL